MKNVFWRRLCALIGGCPAEEEGEEETVDSPEQAERQERRHAALDEAKAAQDRAWEVRRQASRARAGLQHKRD